MGEAVLVAIITGAFASVSAVVSIILSSRMTIYRIEQLEKKVEKHNNMIERLYKAEENISANEKRIENLELKK